MTCADCCASSAKPPTNEPRWRHALWIALGINACMFAVEIVAGIAGGSRAPQADAFDFLSDAANYAISLGVAGLALTWRARAALFKGTTLILLGLYVLGIALWGVWHGAAPEPRVMGGVAIAALLANGALALMLYRYRTGDANMRSVWICSRNDAIGNVAVLLAALGVFGKGSAWPDLIVASIMALLGIRGGWQIIAQARGELHVNPSSGRQTSATMVVR